MYVIHDLINTKKPCYPFGEFAKSIEWLEREASNRNPNAQFNLGLCYFYGIKVKKDIVRGKEWVIQAAKRKNLSAIGLSHIFGWGDYEENYNEAFRHFMESYKQRGDAWAMFYIGQCYNEGYGVIEDKQKALEWFMKAAAFNCLPAMCMIGCRYFRGVGVEEDYDEAFEWFEKSAAENFSLAFFTLGFFLSEWMGS